MSVIWSVTATRGERAAHQPKFTVSDRSLLFKNVAELTSTLYFSISVVLSFSFILQWTSMMAVAWFAQSVIHGVTTLVFYSCGNTGSCHEALCMIFVYGAISTSNLGTFFFICKIPAWNSLANSTFGCCDTQLVLWHEGTLRSKWK